MELNIEKKIPQFIMASLLTSYPDEGFVDYVDQLKLGSEMDLSEILTGWLETITKDGVRLDDVRSQYLELFDSGRGVAPLYETEYGRQRAFFKANELADLAGFYKAFGFEFGEENAPKEMADHISVELEFYALLLMKQKYLVDVGDPEGVEIVNDARKKFLKDHLGRFIHSVLKRPGVSDSEFYREVFTMCENIVDSECAELGVTPEQVDWIAEEAETAEVCCGGAVTGLK